MEDVDELTDPTTDPLASDLVVACEAVWRSIQSHHPELPPAVMLLGSGVERGRLVKLGHWWGGRWLADGYVRGEVLLAGEALHLKPTDVFEVLLHEAAHGINAARGVKDTSRGGRYHNARFKATAVEVGLDVAQMDPYGFAKTTVRPETAKRYSAEIDHLAGVMRIARRIPSAALAGVGVETTQSEGQPDGQGDRDETKRQQVKPAECGCGRRMRMAPSVLAQGPVTCGLCGSEFSVDRGAQQATTAPVVRSEISPGLDGPPAGSFEQQAERLLAAEARGPEGLDVALRLGRWRAGFGTDAEHPICLSRPEERERWDGMARAVLTVDGLLSGPAIELSDGMEVRAGDRVVVQRSVADELPEPGTPGVVTDVRTGDDVAMVDFATAGVYRVRADSTAASALAYDYCELDTPSVSLEAAPDLVEEIDLEVGVGL